jgi:hypothetical protein
METIAAETWLQTTLTASAPLGSVVTGIYSYHNPQGSAFPYVIYNHMAGDDNRNVNGTAVHSELFYQVKVIHAGSAGFYAAGTVFDIVRLLLEGVRGTALNYNILGCVRTQSVQYEETSEGVRYLHLGAIYRVTVAGTA